MSPKAACSGTAPFTRQRRLALSLLTARESRWLLAESTRLLDRLFAEGVAPLAAYFSRHGKLTKRDIADLRRLIEEIVDDD